MENIQELLNIIRKDYNEDDSKIIEVGLKQSKVTTFRVNTLLSNSNEIEQQLILNEIKYQKYDKLNNVYFIENNDIFKIEQLDIYKKGKIYMQNISSMLPSYCLDASKNQEILDMCASPGGKTSLICAITENMSHIMACELNKQRYERLKYNLTKLGCKNVNVMQINANQLDDFYRFDRILLDAPCSGSGTININETESYKYFSVDLVNKCANMQRKLLEKAYKLLKKGETMIYSTCSILKQENEDIVKPFVKSKLFSIIKIDELEKKFADLLLSSNLENVYTIKPTNLTQGFFICRLRKN